MKQAEKTACFTGHRDIKPEHLGTVRNNLFSIVERLISLGYLYFGAGGARGFDTVAAETVVELRKKYPSIKLILVLPFKNQYEHEIGWKERDKSKYHFLLTQANKTVYLQEEYGKGIYYKRDRYLVDFSSVCVCYQYKDSGGTAYTTKYAQEQGLKVINVLFKDHDFLW